MSVLNVDRCLTGRGLGDVHVRCLQRHRGVELEWDALCQRYSQNSHFVSLLHFTLLTPAALTLHLRAPQIAHSLPTLFIRVCSRDRKPKKSTVTQLDVDESQPIAVITLSCLCVRKRSFLSIQSVRVHPASRASTEACSDRGDQRQRHAHLAVQPS